MKLKQMKELPDGTRVHFQGSVERANGTLRHRAGQVIIEYDNGNEGIIWGDYQAECFSVLRVTAGTGHAPAS